MSDAPNGKKDPYRAPSRADDDTVRRELLEVTHSAVSEMPLALERLSVAVDGMKREQRLLRMETRRTRNASGTGWKRVVPKTPPDPDKAGSPPKT